MTSVVCCTDALYCDAGQFFGMFRYHFEVIGDGSGTFCLYAEEGAYQQGMSYVMQVSPA